MLRRELRESQQAQRPIRESRFITSIGTAVRPCSLMIDSYQSFFELAV
jgi:hypothetical protein